jgi:hypothetical protein
LPFVPGKNISDLVYNSPELLRLNRWFRDNCLRLRINTTVYSETQNISGVRVVDLISSDPALANVTPIPLDENHISISKPKSERSLLYKGIVQFINETLSDGGGPSADEMNLVSQQFKEMLVKGAESLHSFAHDARNLCVKLMPRKPEPPATRPDGPPFPLSGDSHYQYEGDFVTLLTSLARIFRYLVPPDTKVWACIRERRSDDHYHTWVRSNGCNPTREAFTESLHKDSTTVQNLRNSYEVLKDCVIITGVGCDGWTSVKNDDFGENKSVIMGAVLSKSFNPTGYRSFDDPKLNWLLCINADRPHVFSRSHIPLMKACNDIFSWILNSFIRYDAVRNNWPPRPPGKPEPTV